MQYISLGSNCSVTHWLNKLKLRHESYPFDWSRLTIKQLNSILKYSFADYVSTIQLKFISDKHLDESSNPTAVITNKYNITFAHEVLTADIGIENFKLSLTNRVVRFMNFDKKDFITYVRIELLIVKSGYIDELNELIKLLDTINENYIIKLIIHKNSIKPVLKKVKVYTFDDFSPDWTMEHLDWKTILTN